MHQYDPIRDPLLASRAALNVVLFVRFDWPGQVIGFHTERGDIEIDGVTYHGAGALAEIQGGGHSGEAGARDNIGLGLRDLPGELIGDGAHEGTGAPVYVSTGLLGADGKLQGGLRLIYTGFLDGQRIAYRMVEGALVCDIVVSVAGAEDPRDLRSVRHSSSGQGEKSGGDTFLRHLPQVEEQPPAWPEPGA